MDDRIYPGLPEAKEFIIKEVKRFLNVKKIVGRKNEVVGCKRLILFLMQEFYKDWTLEEYGKTIDVGHSVVIHYRNEFSVKYYTPDSFYNFLLLNLKAKVHGWESFEMKDIYADVIERIDVPEAKKVRAEFIMNYKIIAYKVNNVVVRAFIMYLIRQDVSPQEIGALMGIRTVTEFSGIDFPDKYKDLYLSTVESVVRDKIAFLKSQEASKNNNNNEKRKTDHSKT